MILFLQAAMALVKVDETGKMTSFEETASYLLPSDPVAKKRQESPGKRAHGNISSVSTKKSDGTSGVKFRYYKKLEYDTLSNAQKDELRQWKDFRQDKKNLGQI